MPEINDAEILAQKISKHADRLINIFSNSYLNLTEKRNSIQFFLYKVYDDAVIDSFNLIDRQEKVIREAREKVYEKQKKPEYNKLERAINDYYKNHPNEKIIDISEAFKGTEIHKKV